MTTNASFLSHRGWMIFFNEAGLSAEDCEKYAQIFFDNGTSLARLAELDHATLVAMEMLSESERRAVLKKRDKLVREESLFPGKFNPDSLILMQFCSGPKPSIITVYDKVGKPVGRPLTKGEWVEFLKKVDASDCAAAEIESAPPAALYHFEAKKAALAKVFEENNLPSIEKQEKFYAGMCLAFMLIQLP